MCAPRIRLWFESTVDWSAAFESLLKVEVLPIKPKRCGGATEPGPAPPPGECVTLCQMTRGLLAAGILNRDMCLVLFDEADVLRGAHRRTLRTRPRCAPAPVWCSRWQSNLIRTPDQ